MSLRRLMHSFRRARASSRSSHAYPTIQGFSSSLVTHTVVDRPPVSLEKQTPLVIVLPTGGGKSLLFTLPACIEGPGVTVVVVPFRALEIHAQSDSALDPFS
jgi:hypothetical protein